MLLRIRDIVRRSVRPFGLAVFSSLRPGLGTKRWFSSHGAQCASCRQWLGSGTGDPLRAETMDPPGPSHQPPIFWRYLHRHPGSVRRWGLVAECANSGRGMAAGSNHLARRSAPLLEAPRTLPIVFVTVVDPVGAGFVASLAQPGGNATGFTIYEYSMSGKWLELLKEIAPGVTRIRDVSRSYHSHSRRFFSQSSRYLRAITRSLSLACASALVYMSVIHASSGPAASLATMSQNNPRAAWRDTSSPL